MHPEPEPFALLAKMRMNLCISNSYRMKPYLKQKKTDRMGIPDFSALHASAWTSSVVNNLTAMGYFIASHHFPSIMLVVASLILVNLIQLTSAYVVDNNPYRHFVTLDNDGKYQLEWLVDWTQRRVIFNVTVSTLGYVGFGLAKKGKMVGADIVIGGVYPNGKSYFTDRYAIANQLPEVDPSQDWTLHHAWERSGKTFLSFSRPFDTCDKNHDLPITDDVVAIIWAYSEVDDQLQYHFQNRGVYSTYLLDPDLVPRSIDPTSTSANANANKKYKKESSDSNMKRFSMRRQMVLPPQDTAYWCSFHKAPTTNKHHIIGFNTVFPTERDRTHVHHLLLHRCTAPPGTDARALFEGPARGEGSECYFLDRPNPLPIQYCRETIHVWAVNGRAIFFPQHVGLPMSESGTEYFLLQVHYDNPNVLADLDITVNLDAYYTSDLRENDAGMLQLGEQIPGSTSIVIPPSSLDHVIVGHCAPGCMDRMFPQTGVNVFAGFLHTHISGRGVRFLHHRGNQELPWILYDDNYNFNYQQFRILRQERRLLPGDHLMTRCVYDTTERNGSVITGGFSTREEMCTSFMYYYPKSRDFGRCRSEIRTREYWNLLGIRNTTWDESRRQVIVTNPPQYSGMSIQDYANEYIDWTLDTREALQRHHLFDPQVSQCPRLTSQAQGIISSPVQQNGRTLTRYSPKGKYQKPSPRGLSSLSRIGGGLDGEFDYNYKDEADDDTNETFTDTDPNSEHVSVNPRGIPRFRRPTQCIKDSKSPWMAKKRQRIN